MSTWGYFYLYDEKAANVQWSPLREADRDGLLAAVVKHVPDADAEALEGLETDGALLSGLFGELAVVADSPVVTFAKHGTTRTLVQALNARFGNDGPARHLQDAEDQYGLVVDERELVPVPRSVWGALWNDLRPLDSSAVPLSAADVLKRQDGVDSESTEFTLAALGFVGWALADTPHSIAISFEELQPVPRLRALPPHLAVLRDALLEAGLPPWDWFDSDDGAVSWSAQLDAKTTRTHALVTREARLRHLRWARPSAWRRFLGDGDWNSLGGFDGPCSTTDCMPCRAAGFVAERLRHA
jgi:hypothetical protein